MMREPGKRGMWRFSPAGAEGVLARLRRNRRGAVAVGFGVSVVGFLGLAGLATEAGYWYSAHRKGQNAADAAAISAAASYAHPHTVAVSLVAGRDTAVKNGFTNSDGTTACTNTGVIRVCINHPPTSGTHMTNGYFEAIIQQEQTPTFARIFGITSKIITNRAVAGLSSSGQACVLALEDRLGVSGGYEIHAPNCMIASNNSDPDSIYINGSASVDVQSMHAVGGCVNCDYDPQHPTRMLVPTPYTAYSTPTPNPFVALDSVDWTPIEANYTTAAGTCMNSIPQSQGTAITLAPTSTSGIAFCDTLQMQNNDIYVLQPGTYVFKDHGLQIQGGSLTCPTCNSDPAMGTVQGVSIILIGDDPGDVTINCNCTVQLNGGPNTTSINANLAGVVLYRKNDGDEIGGSLEVMINGGNNSYLSGGLYFPRADLRQNGNSLAGCSLVVSGSIELNGNAWYTTSGCSSLGVTPSRVQSVVLVE